MNEKVSTLESVINPQQLEQRLGCSCQKIAKFCQKRDIIELALFGSVLREDFNPNSDIDFLVTFSPEVKISLKKLDEIEEELKQIVNREIDLVFKKSIESSHNWIRKRNILETAKVIYESRTR